jgi:hypothetical protein
MESWRLKVQLPTVYITVYIQPEAQEFPVPDSSYHSSYPDIEDGTLIQSVQIPGESQLPTDIKQEIYKTPYC